jgi:hypothetical protein
LLTPAIKQAEELGVCWEKSVIRLTPTEELKKLVELSDALGPSKDSDADADADDQVTLDAGAEG